MGVTIGSNIASLRAQRSLAQSRGTLASTYQRLSSGKRINKASDDAAGLTVADNLNVEARLSSAAVRNVNDGLSAVNIVTGALDSQKQILFRMAELAEQSANGVYSHQQRSALDNEYQSLMLEFDRIASTTNFNGVNLLRDPNQGSLHIMAGITGADSSLLQMTAANSHRFAGVYGMRSDGNNNNFVNSTDATLIINQLEDPFIHETTPYADRLQGYASFAVTDSHGKFGTARLAVHRVFNDLGFLPVPLARSGPHGVSLKAKRGDGDIATVNTTYDVSGSNKRLTVNFAYANSGATGSVALDLSNTQFLSLDAGVEIKQTAIGFTNCLTAANARQSLDTVNNRMEEISALQGQYGALQARLDLSGSMLQVSGENLRAAESRIRDADIAEEAAVLTRTGILQQAGAAVLGQANQQPVLALQLL